MPTFTFASNNRVFCFYISKTGINKNILLCQWYILAIHHIVLLSIVSRPLFAAVSLEPEGMRNPIPHSINLLI